jgi:hypothetical protein
MEPTRYAMKIWDTNKGCRREGTGSKHGGQIPVCHASTGADRVQDDPILTRTRTHLEILLEELDVFRVREKVSRLLALCRKILSFVHKFFRSIEHSNGPAHTRTGEIGL